MRISSTDWLTERRAIANALPFVCVLARLTALLLRDLHHPWWDDAAPQVGLVAAHRVLADDARRVGCEAHAHVAAVCGVKPAALHVQAACAEGLDGRARVGKVRVARVQPRKGGRQQDGGGAAADGASADELR